MELLLRASWRYMSSGTPGIDAGVPLFHLTIDLSLPCSFRSAESNRAIKSKGSTGNLCVRLLCFCTQILKRGFLGLAQMVMQYKIIMEVFLMKVANVFKPR